MYSKLFKFIFTGCLLISISGYSQQLDSIQKLDEVTVTGSRFRYFNSGYFYTSIDSSTKALHAGSYLGDILSNSSLLQINNYGVGSVSVSARGMGEKRTPVVWNGFNIQSILSTGADLSQLPSFFFENVHAQMGGSSALFGSGAAGGVLFLSNSQKLNSGVSGQLISNVGSFGNYYGGAELSVSDNKYSGSVKMYYNKTKNNFPYKATFSGTEIDTTQSNAGANQYGFMFNNFLRFANSGVLNFNVWYTNSDKNIAPTLYDVASNSEADGNQKDRFFAASTQYSTELNNLHLSIRSGFFNTRLNYERPSWMEISESKALWWVNELEATASIAEFIKINGGFNFTYENAKSSSFTEKENRYREALFASVKYNDPNIKIAVTANGRGEVVAGEFIPFTWSTGLEYSPLNYITLKGNIAKNYRLPSFNDLYYTSPYSEGNPYLKPEDGINFESGIEIKQKKENFNTVLGGNWFLSRMDNWINWAERPDGIWSVFNIDKAELTGIETFYQAAITEKIFEVSGKFMYSYIEAKDRNSGKAIAHVPQHKFTFNASARFYSTSLIYRMTNVSERYSNSTNTSITPAYNISDIIISQSIKYFGSSFSFDFGLYNLFNKDYMVMDSYPMPRRNFRASLRILF
jgi:iron complex outermembrane receptor protein